MERHRGFAHVTYASVAEAQKAVATLNGKDFEGRALVVEHSKPLSEKPHRAPRAEQTGERAVHKDRIVVRNLPREVDSDKLQGIFQSEFRS